jgi:hypothetical protein
MIASPGMLHLLGKYLVRGPEVIGLMDARREKLAEFFTLEEFQSDRGIQQRTSIFLATVDFARAQTPPILRRAIWNRRSDLQELRQAGFLDWPTVDVSYVSSRAYEALLDEMLRELEQSVSSIRLASQGLHWNDESPAEDSLRTDSLRMASIHSNVLMEVHFNDGAFAPLDHAWDKLWREFASIFSAETTLQCQEYYDLDPKEYLEALKQSKAASG